MNKYKHEVYSEELKLNKENNVETHCTFLDIDIHITNENDNIKNDNDIIYDNFNNNDIVTKLYDKRNDFPFEVNNFPVMSSNILFHRTHGIIISQLIRYSKVCMNYEDFLNVTNILIQKLKNQFFDIKILEDYFSNFYNKYYHLIQHYEHTKQQMLQKLF